jgi:hypothetical protein
MLQAAVAREKRCLREAKERLHRYATELAEVRRTLGELGIELVIQSPQA